MKEWDDNTQTISPEPARLSVYSWSLSLRRHDTENASKMYLFLAD